MSTALNFKPDYYKITRLLESNVLEVEDTWFIKLKGVNDSVSPEELKKWLKEGDIVRIIPYRRNNEARIISDVWLGNTHINRQFSSYKKDNLMQEFENLCNRKQPLFGPEVIKAEEEFISAVHMAWLLLNNEQQKSFKYWMECRGPQRREGPSIGIEELTEKRRIAKDKMVKEFEKLRNKYE